MLAAKNKKITRTDANVDVLINRLSINMPGIVESVSRQYFEKKTELLNAKKFFSL